MPCLYLADEARIIPFAVILTLSKVEGESIPATS
jgi:hypothetical protein